MEINANQAPISAKNAADSANIINSQMSHKNGIKQGMVPDNLAAYNVTPNIMDNILNFDVLSDKFVNFTDMLGTVQGTLAKMQEQGKCLCDLINKAHEEGQSEETLKEINSEVASKVAEIDGLYKSAEFNGINPFEAPFGITIPNWQNVFGVEETSEPVENQIAEFLTSIDFNFDMSVNIDGKEFNMQAAATINIGYTEDGALQISVDASMDYDLSGIVESGAESENALDIITRFLSLLSGKQDGFDYAANFINKLFEKASTSLDEFKYLFPEVSGADSSTELKGQITQHAAITLDGANQAPNIAINIL